MMRMSMHSQKPSLGEKVTDLWITNVSALVWRTQRDGQSCASMDRMEMKRKLVKGCGGQFRMVKNIHEASTGFKESTCFFCSTGMCVPCRRGGRQGKSQTEGGTGRECLQRGSVQKLLTVTLLPSYF